MKTFTKYGIAATAVSAIVAIVTGVEPIWFFTAALALITVLDYTINSPLPEVKPVAEVPAETNHSAVMEAPIVAVAPSPATEVQAKKTRAKKATPAIKAAPAKKTAPKKEPVKKAAAPAKKAPAKAKK